MNFLEIVTIHRDKHTHTHTHNRDILHHRRHYQCERGDIQLIILTPLFAFHTKLNLLTRHEKEFITR